MFLRMNKFLITENMFLPRSVIGTLQVFAGIPENKDPGL